MAKSRSNPNENTGLLSGEEKQSTCSTFITKALLAAHWMDNGFPVLLLRQHVTTAVFVTVVGGYPEKVAGMTDSLKVQIPSAVVAGLCTAASNRSHMARSMTLNTYFDGLSSFSDVQWVPAAGHYAFEILRGITLPVLICQIIGYNDIPDDIRKRLYFAMFAVGGALKAQRFKDAITVTAYAKMRNADPSREQPSSIALKAQWCYTGPVMTLLLTYTINIMATNYFGFQEINIPALKGAGLSWEGLLIGAPLSTVFAVCENTVQMAKSHLFETSLSDVKLPTTTAAATTDWKEVSLTPTQWFWISCSYLSDIIEVVGPAALFAALMGLKEVSLPWRLLAAGGSLAASGLFRAQSPIDTQKPFLLDNKRQAADKKDEEAAAPQYAADTTGKPDPFELPKETPKRSCCTIL